MATIKISQFPTMSASDADSANDVLPIIDTNLGTNKKITLDNLGSSITASHAITASYALNASGGGGGGSVGTLQQVMESGSSTTLVITASAGISSSGGFIGEYLAAGTPGVGVNRIAMGITNRIDINPNNTVAVRLSDSLVTLNKDTSVNGHITASGNISSSANITGNVVNVRTRVKAIGSSLEFAGDELSFVDGNSSSQLFKGTSAGAFEAYHAGNKKLETTATGVNITGNITASGNISSSSTITADTTSTKNLFSSGSVKRRVREVTLTVANSSGGSGMPAIQADDDIILVTGNTTGAIGVNDYTLNCNNIFYGNTSEIGRTVTIVNASSAVGSDLVLGSPTPGGDYTANGFSQSGKFGPVCTTNFSEVTIVLRANDSVIIYGSGI